MSKFVLVLSLTSHSLCNGSLAPCGKFKVQNQQELKLEMFHEVPNKNKVLISIVWFPLLLTKGIG
jgi:hypothetical protein